MADEKQFSFNFVLNTTTTYHNEVVKFSPALYQQRYAATMTILEDERWYKGIKKVVEFGCADMKLFHLMKNYSAEHIMLVDIDAEILKSSVFRLKPLISDYIRKRKSPLRVDVFQGNMIDPDENLRNTDAVIGIEIIEHLYPDVLEKVPANIFGFIKPKLVIFSTPNQEYNVLFGQLRSNGFRIDDHKFEWTRQEFENWALNICTTYPNYKVHFIGVGKPPADRSDIGFCSQMAIFARIDILGEQLVDDITSDLTPATDDPAKQYKIMESIEYPFDPYEPSVEDQMRNRIECYVYQDEEFFDDTDLVYKVPIRPLLEYGESIDADKALIFKIFKEKEFNIDGDFIILTDADDSTDSSSLDNDVTWTDRFSNVAFEKDDSELGTL